MSDYSTETCWYQCNTCKQIIKPKLRAWIACKCHLESNKLSNRFERKLREVIPRDPETEKEDYVYFNNKLHGIMCAFTSAVCTGIAVKRKDMYDKVMGDIHNYKRIDKDEKV